MRPHRLAFCAVALVTLLFALPNACAAQTEDVLYSFTLTGSDGAYPIGGLVFDGEGNLYGTTSYGGSHLAGTVFKLAPPTIPGGAWTKTTIYSFTGGSDGFNPFGRLAFHQRALYGTAESGGSACSISSTGCGVVFQITQASGSGWQYKVLHSFAGGSDGAAPFAGVTFDTAGNLYGTTFYGGGATACAIGKSVTGCGTAYELSPPTISGGVWNETVLYTFTGSADGELPESAVVFDKAGALYGSANVGALGQGLIYRLSPPAAAGAAWQQSVLYAFKWGNYDGGDPIGDLTFDRSGNLFGATLIGTGTDVCFPNGCGTVFKLLPPPGSAGSWTERIIHKFGTGADGIQPSGGVVMDAMGSLYGATDFGGNSTAACSQEVGGCGTIYKLARPATSGGIWDETILYNFSSDGYLPNGGLLLDSTRAIYGTTEFGGQQTNPCPSIGCGTVFQVTQ